MENNKWDLPAFPAPMSVTDKGVTKKEWLYAQILSAMITSGRYSDDQVIARAWDMAHKATYVYP